MLEPPLQTYRLDYLTGNIRTTLAFLARILPFLVLKSIPIWTNWPNNLQNLAPSRSIHRDSVFRCERVGFRDIRPVGVAIASRPVTYRSLPSTLSKERDYGSATCR